MRQFLLIALAAVLLVGTIILLSLSRPGAQPDLFAATVTPLPDGFTLLPPFTPSAPCELRSVDVLDRDMCRSERVSETRLASGDGVDFIDHQYTVSTGCWHGITSTVRELRVCSRTSGAVDTLTPHLITDFVPSPDGAWYVYGTMNPLAEGHDALRPHVFRVRGDGTDAQPLDTQGFPDWAVGAPVELRWLDAGWLAFRLWDGTTGGWHPYRLRADGSGEYTPLVEGAAQTP